jgi:hypothetical protein
MVTACDMRPRGQLAWSAGPLGRSSFPMIRTSAAPRLWYLGATEGAGVDALPTKLTAHHNRQYRDAVTFLVTRGDMH